MLRSAPKGDVEGQPPGSRESQDSHLFLEGNGDEHYRYANASPYYKRDPASFDSHIKAAHRACRAR